MRNPRHWLIVAAFAGVAALVATPGVAQKKYDPGASDTEIKIGNIMPYSGPNSVFGEIAKTEGAYFRRINAEGGINGRKINFISYDDAYSPPKTVEQARKRRSFAHLQLTRHGDQHRDPEIHEYAQSAATFH
jgi:ABC-type branched-subunit amino acid transport system substrate-binding protein